MSPIAFQQSLHLDQLTISLGIPLRPLVIFDEGDHLAISSIPTFSVLCVALALEPLPPSTLCCRARTLPCWKYALETTGFDPLVGLDGFDPLWCKSPNGPQML
jgi:hypothetical protein